MTNEDVIKILEAYRDKLTNSVSNQLDGDIEAFSMAIKALETIPKYKDAYGKGWIDGAKASYEHLKMCEEEQEISGDLISRDAVLDILKKEGHKWGNDYRDWVDAVNEVETLPSVKQEPCDKCVYSTKDGYCQYDDITETIPPFNWRDEPQERSEKE